MSVGRPRPELAARAERDASSPPVVPVPHAFVGRQAELRQLRLAWDGATAGRPRTVLVEGAAGMGKTILLRRFIEDLGGVRTVVASGEEAESSLPYAVLDQLLGDANVPAMVHPPDALAAGASLLALIGDLQHDGPLLLVIDDAHWADTPSLHALTFALRRLRADRVLALLSARPEESQHLPAGLLRLVNGRDGSVLALTGLTAPEVGELSEAIGTGSLPTGDARRLVDHTGGNPLHTIALLQELGAGGLRSTVDPLPAPESFRMTISRRLASCSGDAQALLEVGAVLGRRWSVDLAARMAGVDDPLPAAQEGVDQGLLSVSSEHTGRLAAFAHPLVRAAIYHRIGLAKRARLHHLAAASIEDEGTSLLHRAVASSRPNAPLAGELEHFALRRVGVAPRAGADAFLLAAQLSSSREEHDLLTLEAFECLVAAGDLGTAAETATQLDASVHAGAQSYAKGLLAWFGGELPAAQELLERAWRAFDVPSHRVQAGRAAGWLAILEYLMGRTTESLEWARRAIEANPDAPSPSVARSILLSSLAVTGRSEEGLALVARLPPVLVDIGPEDINDALGRGLLRMSVDRPDLAVRDLEAAVDASRLRSLQFTVVGWFYLSDAEYRVGRWPAAVAAGEAAISAAVDGDFVIAQACSYAVSASALAGLGHLDAARERAHAAAEMARATGDVVGRVWAAVANARVAEAAGDPERQIGACDPLLELSGNPIAEEPSFQPWRDLYADALLRMGRVDDADIALEAFEAMAATRSLASGEARAGRVRAMIEAARDRPNRAKACFESALRRSGHVPMPYLRAQVELSYGAFLRRQGQRRAAVQHLEAARTILEHLGARPLLHRCDKELMACGQAASGRRRGGRAQLTPQELSVAHLVSKGLSNREVASQMILSVKTVEYHLSHVFDKLGVRSRAQLVALLARDEGAEAGTGAHPGDLIGTD